MANPMHDRQNWSQVELAYGVDADLYIDVLKIPAKSSMSEIAKAHSNGMLELSTLLPNLESTCSFDAEVRRAQKHLLECRMQSVALAGRILLDKDLREQYHLQHSHRIRAGISKSQYNNPTALFDLLPEQAEQLRTENRFRGGSSRKDRKSQWREEQSGRCRRNGSRRRETLQDDEYLNASSHRRLLVDGSDNENENGRRKASRHRVPYKPPRCYTNKVSPTKSPPKRMTRSFSNRANRSVGDTATSSVH